MGKRTIDSATRRRLAVEASVDPRTIDRVLAGQPVRGLASYRAREALKANNIAFPEPSLPPPPASSGAGFQKHEVTPKHEATEITNGEE
jgi:hypothetical protein